MNNPVSDEYPLIPSGAGGILSAVAWPVPLDGRSGQVYVGRNHLSWQLGTRPKQGIPLDALASVTLSAKRSVRECVMGLAVLAAVSFAAANRNVIGFSLDPLDLALELVGAATIGSVVIWKRRRFTLSLVLRDGRTIHLFLGNSHLPRTGVETSWVNALLKSWGWLQGELARRNIATCARIQ